MKNPADKSTLANEYNSFLHRCLIMAALSKAECLISDVAVSFNVSETLNSLRKLNIEIREESNALIVNGRNFVLLDQLLASAGNDSTFRFLLSFVTFLKSWSGFHSENSLVRRSFSEYAKTVKSFCRENGIRRVRDILDKNEYHISRNVSSQLITVLAMLLPLLPHDTAVGFEQRVDEIEHLTMTVYCLKQFGIEAVLSERAMFVPADQKYQPSNFSFAAAYNLKT